MAPSTVITAGGGGGGGGGGKNKKKSKKSNPSPRSVEDAATTELAPDEQSGSNSAGSPPPVMEFEAASGGGNGGFQPSAEASDQKKESHLESLDSLYKVPDQSVPLEPEGSGTFSRNLWLFACFFGIMVSFVAYGLLLEYATSGGRKLHELSFLFVTSGLYTLTAAAGRHVRDEKPTSIPPARFAVLGLTSMGSTFCSVRSLRYVIYPIQVLAKSCKPVPVMLMGALMGKKYPLRKYLNVIMIVVGVALFMGGGSSGSKKGNENVGDASSQIVGILLLFVSLCFDGGTGAYEDKLMAVHSVGPFDLMYNIQLGKTILAGIGLVVLNQVHEFLRMCHEMGFLLIALGLSGALGQVFIFVTIAKFGALTCSIIGLARKITTLVASIVFFGHSLSLMQFGGLVISVGSMVMNFWGKKKSKAHGSPPDTKDEETEKLLDEEEGVEEDDDDGDDNQIELVPARERDGANQVFV